MNYSNKQQENSLSSVRKKVIDNNNVDADKNELDENINEGPIKKNGKVSICNIELLVEEDSEVPDKMLHLYNIEEEYIGFGGGYCLDKLYGNGTCSRSSINVNHSSTRLCYTSLWKKLPQNIPVRELALSRNHIAVLLNNGHVYVALNELDDSGDININCNINDNTKRRLSITSSVNDNLNDVNEQRNSVNSGNTLLLENYISNCDWFHVKELDNKNIRGIKIASFASSYNDFEYKKDNKSFVLGSLSIDGKVWIVEYNSAINNINLKYLDLGIPENDESCKLNTNCKLTRAIDITFSEIRPLNNDEIECFGDNNEMNKFPNSYGIAITCLSGENESNCIVLKSNLETIESNTLLLNKTIILDLPYICRNIFCGIDMEYGFILLQNGTLWGWELKEKIFRKIPSDSSITHFPINARQASQNNINDNENDNSIFVRSSGDNNFKFSIELKRINGSLTNKKVVDFSGLNGEFIALTNDGLISEWNVKSRKTLFTRPLIEDPIIFTPKSHHEIMKSIKSKFSFPYLDTSKIFNLKSQNDYVGDLDTPDHSQLEKENSPLNSAEGKFEHLIKSEIKEMYDLNNKIIGVWLLEGITLVLHKDSTLKAIYNYIGRDGYNTKTGLVSEDDKINGGKQVSSMINCIQWSNKLGRCIPANPIALVGLLSNFSEYKSLPEKLKQLSIQRSLVKLSLRERPVYRILACYDTIIFGILRSTPKWRQARNSLTGHTKDKRDFNGDNLINSNRIQSKIDLSSCLDVKKDERYNCENKPINENNNLKEKRKVCKKKQKKYTKNEKKMQVEVEVELKEKKSVSSNRKLGTSNNETEKEINDFESNKIDEKRKQYENISNSKENIGPEVQSAEEKTVNKRICESNNKRFSENDVALTSLSYVVNHLYISSTDSSFISLSQSPSTVPTCSEKERGQEANNMNQLTSQKQTRQKNTVISTKTSTRRSKINSNLNSSQNISNSKTRKRERASSSEFLNENVDPNISTSKNGSREKIHKVSDKKINEDLSSEWEPKKVSLIEYEVEQILSIREKPLTKQKEYLIKWKVPGHPVQPTWEPEENLSGCEELLKEFLKNIKTSRSGRLLLPCTHAH
ncbi:chromatin associated protein with a chromodomain at the C-terminus [Cryptosporidium ryanae]|uniref:chromatin associated protein with a chromodomain at the C-terminus n=1 Tax=Cryptosporidium ryanae TaxID=515981 RepID=UPI00351A3D2B|nr:chromatin associated protein with a chromodomain at the C-terminus [Cryptosporidium ryanae]